MVHLTISNLTLTTYKADAVVYVGKESEGRQGVKKEQFLMRRTRQKYGSTDGEARGNQQPVESFAVSVTHLGDDQSAANVGEDDANLS